MQPNSTAAVPGRREVGFGFLNAKLRARRSRLCDQQRLEELAGLGSVRNLASELYPSAGLGNSLELERRLRADCIAELTGYLAYLPQPCRHFYRALLTRYPAENLKVLLRLFVSGGGEPDDYLAELPPEMSLPAEELMGSARVEDFVGRIPDPRMRQAARSALDLYAESGRKAWLEMAFDRGYWLGVWQGLGALPRSEKEQCAPALRAELEAVQLLGALRAAARYQLSWERWEQVMPLGGTGLSADHLQQVYEDPTVEHACELFPWLGGVLDRFLPEEESPDLGHLEEALWHRAVRAANRAYYSHLHGPAVLVSYFYLKREELRHLMALTQMLRYGEGKTEIMRYLEI